MSDVVVSQPQNLPEMIREQVRQTILKTIPDEQIDKLVQKEWNSFFVAPERRNHYDTVQPSEFEKMVRTAVHEFFKERVLEAIKKELNEMGHTWSPTAEATAALQKMVKQYAPVALEGMSERIAETSLRNFMQSQNNINGGMPRQW